MSNPKFEYKDKEAFLNGEKIGFFNDPDDHFQATRGNAVHREAFLAWHEEQKREKAGPESSELPTNPEIGKVDIVENETAPDNQHAPSLSTDASPGESAGPPAGAETAPIESATPQKTNTPEANDSTPPETETAPAIAKTETVDPPVPEKEPRQSGGRGIHDPAYFYWAWHQPEEDFRQIYGVTQTEWQKGESAGRIDEVKRILSVEGHEPGAAVPRIQPHQQRVIDEKKELDEKANKLSEFIGNNPVFESLDPAEQERLKVQNDLMWQYSEVLGERIAAFSEAP